MEGDRGEGEGEKGENENEKVPNKGERIQPTIKASFEQMSKCALACDRNK